ncbi:Hypothetical predicted protein [Paramuricea clavata]|uniref:Uncharacterized protein n=1 Tax=Paramuricea clavata TaxID=317549 RepID=A0A7D9EJB2_PARCT|nr:Hypothetical predicted protein [Paramuricea clavata]
MSSRICSVVLRGLRTHKSSYIWMLTLHPISKNIVASFHIQKYVEKELQRLEDLDIIEQVDGSTTWVSPIVAPTKTGEIRLCVDMREANKAVQREKHPIPTVDELITYFNGATVFCTIDLVSVYHQLELLPESRHFTTFTTQVGLRRYK